MVLPRPAQVRRRRGSLAGKQIRCRSPLLEIGGWVTAARRTYRQGQAAARS